MNSFSKVRLNKGTVLRFDNGLFENTCFLRHFSFHLFQVFRALSGKCREDEFSSFSATFARVLSSMPCNDLLDMSVAKLSKMRKRFSLAHDVPYRNVT